MCVLSWVDDCVCDCVCFTATSIGINKRRVYDIAAVMREMGWLSTDKEIEKTTAWGSFRICDLLCPRPAKDTPLHVASHSVLWKLALEGYFVPSSAQLEYMVLLVLFGLGIVERHKEGPATVYSLMRPEYKFSTFTV